ncbi:hypothetical protein [Blastopirellula retiformator]|uniref:hypothetical protein n=1 Tax=Blastopirellula retiformator TaxID=2527970 RepID=UPI0011B75B7B|nr:hypothetical protein [Blastopirellula retiformator]
MNPENPSQATRFVIEKPTGARFLSTHCFVLRTPLPINEKCAMGDRQRTRKIRQKAQAEE